MGDLPKPITPRLKELVAKWRNPDNFDLRFSSIVQAGHCADELEALIKQVQYENFCLGYPDCDGDLPGEPHSAKCDAAREAIKP